MFWTDCWLISAVYTAWLIIDWNTPKEGNAPACSWPGNPASEKGEIITAIFHPPSGGRRSSWVRNWTVWSYFRDYFPIRVGDSSAPGVPANLKNCWNPPSFCCFIDLSHVHQFDLAELVRIAWLLRPDFKITDRGLWDFAPPTVALCTSWWRGSPRSKGKSHVYAGTVQ